MEIKLTDDVKLLQGVFIGVLMALILILLGVLVQYNLGVIN